MSSKSKRVNIPHIEQYVSLQSWKISQTLWLIQLKVGRLLRWRNLIITVHVWVFSWVASDVWMSHWIKTYTIYNTYIYIYIYIYMYPHVFLLILAKLYWHTEDFLIICTVLTVNTQRRGWQTFSMEDHIVKILGFVGHMVSLKISQLALEWVSLVAQTVKNLPAMWET